MSRMNFYFRLMVACLLMVSALWATPSGYTSIYVFGDGVSTTTQNTPSPAPANLYFGNRYCDGEVWVEKLSQSRGITYAPAKNISYFGHYSSSMVTSVNNLPAPADAATSLFIIWCANADFVKFAYQDAIPPNSANLATWQNAITQSVNNHVTAVNTLRQNKGAKFIMLPTAADIMKVPLFNDYNVTEKAFIRARVVDFNTQLVTAMNSLAAANPELTIVMPNVFGFFDQVIANPSAYGMVDPVPFNSAIDDLANPWTQGRNFVFWDFQHPTAMFQAQLANFINNQIPALDTTPPVLTLPNPAPVVEAAGPSGAVVSFSVSANDAVSGSVPAMAVPASGSLFPLGNSTVTVSASDAAGNTATGNFTVTVRDTTPPALTLPGTLVREASGPSGAVVTFSTSANDTVSGSRTTTATPPSGSTFPLGNSTVTVSATDAAGNTATGNFTVTVRDTTKPVLTLPNPTPVVEATGTSGAVVTFTTSANDAVSGPVATTATPPSGSTFAMGNTTVTVSASDITGNTATGNFTVRVVDTTPPSLILPTNRVVTATGPSGAVVTFTTSATDSVSGPRPTTATPPSGSMFPVGTTTVNVNATDVAGNQANGSFKVTVVNMNALLRNVAISPAGSGLPGISGLIQGGPPNGQVILQASSDLGKNDLWQDIGTIQLDASGSKSFGPIFDPQGTGLDSNFYRVKLPLSP